MSKPAMTTWTQGGAASRRPSVRRGGWLRRLLARLLVWQQRAAMRHDLRQMPDYLLRDIGLTRDAVRAEGQRPFWRE